MNAQCVIAEFETIAAGKSGLELLQKNKYNEQQLSLVTRTDASELKEIGDLRQGEAEKNDQGQAAAIGAVIGGVFATPLAVSTLVGPFILFGPVAGVAAGAAVGALLAGTNSWGVDEQSAKRYEKRVEDGSVLLIVTGTEAELREAEASLKTLGPKSLQSFATPETQAQA